MNRKGIIAVEEDEKDDIGKVFVVIVELEVMLEVMRMMYV